MSYNSNTRGATNNNNYESGSESDNSTTRGLSGDLLHGSVKEHNQLKFMKKVRGKRNFNKCQKRTNKHKKLSSQAAVFDFIRSTTEVATATADVVAKYKKVKAGLLRPKPETDAGTIFATRLEDFVALLTGLATSRSALNAVAIITLYARTWTNKSLVSAVMASLEPLLRDFIRACREDQFVDAEAELTSQDFSIQLEDLATHSGAAAETFRSLIRNWRQHSSCEAAKHLSTIVDILVMLGILPNLNENPLKLGVFTLYKSRAWDMQRHSESFTTMFLDSIDFFLERGYAAFVARDLSLLVTPDDEVAKMEQEYALLMSVLPILESGRLSDLEGHDSFSDETEYDVRLQALLTALSDKLINFKEGPMRNTLVNRIKDLKSLNAKLVLLRKASCVREKPFAVQIFGGSSVGKTTISAAMVKALLHHNGYASKKENVVTLNSKDKFQSEYRPHHTAVVIDDYGNARADKCEINPTELIIDICNNVPKAVLQAELALKGNIMWNPKLLAVTTNVKNLLASLFSNEPVSVQRRMDYVIVARLKPECVCPETGGLNPDSVVGLIPDCWNIDVERVCITRNEGKADTAAYNTVVKNASLREVIELLKPNSKKHFTNQKKFVKKMEDYYDMDLCEHSDDPSQCEKCAASFMDCVTIVDEDEPVKSPTVVSQSEDTDLSEFSEAMPVFDGSEEDLLNEGPGLAPTFCERVQNLWLSQRGLTESIPAQLVRDSRTLLEALNEHKMWALEAALLTLGVSVSAYGIFKLLRSVYRSQIAEQDQSKPLERNPVRLPTDVVNPWKKVVPTRINKSIFSATCVSEQLHKLVDRCLAHVTITDLVEKKERKCNILAISGNVWMVPGHMMRKHTVTFQVQRTAPDAVGCNFTEQVSTQNWVKAADDFVLVRLVNGGSVPHLIKYFPESCDFELTSKLYCDLVYRNAEGFISKDKVLLTEKKRYTTNKTSFDGVGYNCPRPTFDGMCMSTLITCQARPCIIACHLAGVTGECFGAAGIIDRCALETALNQLNSQLPLSVHSEGTVPTTKYGIDFPLSDEINKRHCTKFLTDDEETGHQPVVEVIGAHDKGTAKFTSQVRKSPISDVVAEVTGIERLHGAPKSDCINKHWARDLKQMAHPKSSADPVILEKAYADMITTVDEFIDKDPSVLDVVHLYPKDVVLSGFDGITSVDRVELSSSMGWPINKAKKNFLGPVERTVDGITEVIDFEDPQYWEEVERMEAVLARGERVHAIHRGNLKDEPTKFTKDKIRVFAGCEFAFTCLVRKYYLSLVRLIQGNWLSFETAVGINCHSKQWSKLAKHLTRFGGKRMIAGDYKAFDKNVSPSITRRAFQIMIHVAKRAGYSQEALTIMEGIATEICFPLYELDGVFVQIFGSNPSGHPLTVILNNFVNSLYLRYAYYALYTEHEWKSLPLFNRRISLVCYGDDNAMDVSQKEVRFNHTSVAAELAKIGITYTMADKEAESVPYITIDECSFLKRGFVYSDDLGEWAAPLEEASIAKSLHNYMSRKGSDVLPMQIAADAIENANREFFFHGKETFERRRDQLLQVIEKTDVHEFVSTLPTYEDLIDHYNGQRVKKPLDVEGAVLQLQ